MHNILVFPCGSEIGLEIYRAFLGIKNVKIIGGSSMPDHGKFVYRDYMENLPHIDDKGFISQLNKQIKIHRIDYIFPAHDSVVLKLAQNLHKLDCEVIGSPLKTCEICRSKRKTYAFFKGLINIPRIFNKDRISRGDFPVFLKPNIGQGSKGTFIANNIKEVDFYLKIDPSLLVLEYLPGDEFTVDCLTDFNGNLVYVGARKRNRIINGISVNTYPVQDEEFTKIAKIINNHLTFNGAWFFQVKISDKNKLVLLEIAPRIAGSMALSRIRGVNLPVLSFYNFIKTPITIKPNNFKLIMDRALDNVYKLDIDFKHVYLDFDDCILINNRLNTNLIRFIIQCINDDIQIHLISKHKYNLKKRLKDLKIKDLFTTIQHINKNEKKINYIKHQQSIFVDDSFSERVEILEKLKIPVFAPDSIEALIYEK